MFKLNDKTIWLHIHAVEDTFKNVFTQDPKRVCWSLLCKYRCYKSNIRIYKLVVTISTLQSFAPHMMFTALSRQRWQAFLQDVNGGVLSRRISWFFIFSYNLQLVSSAPTAMSLSSAAVQNFVAIVQIIIEHDGLKDFCRHHQRVTECDLRVNSRC